MPGKTALEHHLSKRSSFHWSMGAAPSRALWCSLEFGGAVPFSTRRQPLVYQLKAEGTRSFRECRFCFVNEGSNCRIRLKPMLSGADDRSRHKAILYSINQVFIIYTPAGRGDGGGGGSGGFNRGDDNSPLLSYNDLHLHAFAPIIPGNGPVSRCHCLRVAVGETEAESSAKYRVRD